MKRAVLLFSALVALAGCADRLASKPAPGEFEGRTFSLTPGERPPSHTRYFEDLKTVETGADRPSQTVSLVENDGVSVNLGLYDQHCQDYTVREADDGAWARGRGFGTGDPAAPWDVRQEKNDLGVNFGIQFKID